MSIPYNYEIVNVDAQARVMEVVYSSPGRQTLHIGARLPFVGEALETIIAMYAPVAYWLEQELEVEVPQIGQTGSVAAPSEASNEPSDAPSEVIHTMEAM